MRHQAYTKLTNGLIYKKAPFTTPNPDKLQKDFLCYCCHLWEFMSYQLLVIDLVEDTLAL